MRFLPEYGARLKTLDIVVILVLIGAILALCLFGLLGRPGPNAPVAAGNLTVHFIDVGKGDAMLVKAGDRCMLVDGGRPEMGPRLVAYLESQGVTSIDVLVSTHPHNDHIGGLPAVLKAFPVKQVVDSGYAHPSGTYESYLKLIDQLDIPYTVGEAGQTIDLGPGVRVEVLAPPASRIRGGANENSIVLKLTYGKVTFLFTGDAGEPEEAYLMSSGYGLRSDVFKVPHHGSWYSANRSFISRVSPEVSVIEVGPNSYGYPASGMLETLAQTGSAIYNTDLNGDVIVTTNGSGLSVISRYKPPAGKPLSCVPSVGGMRCTA